MFNRCREEVCGGGAKAGTVRRGQWQLGSG